LRQKALRQCFLIATTASKVFQQPPKYSRPFAVKKSDPNPWLSVQSVVKNKQ